MATERLTAIVGARINEFQRKMAQVKATAKTVPKRIVTEVVVKGTKRARKNMNAMADFIRDFQTITSNMVTGGLVAISPGLVPMIAGAAGAVAMLGAMGGVVAGSTFALATAFGAAGAAALAFGGISIPTIQKLFDENTKLTKQQQKARKEFEKVTGTWKKITKRLEEPVLEAFTKSMEIAHKVLHMAEPLFDSAAKAVNNLLNSLNKSLDSTAVKGFFDLLNKQGGPMLEILGKAFGNFVRGTLSMMTAFGPLAKDTADGFLSMSQRFADWAQNLKNSKGFKNFVDFVKTNMPKVRAIFRDMIAGIVYMFSAFGPLSSDMLSGFQDMMARFKEWAKALPENPQFQKFIQYIRDNGPMVLDFMGQLTTFLVNLGIGMAPLGSKILELVNSFLAWTNSLMENNPWIGKLIGGIIVAAGVFQALWPIVLTVGSYFMGLWNILKTFVWPMILRAMPIITRVGAVLLRFGTGPIGFIIATVISLAIAIFTNWDSIWSKTKEIFAKIGEFISGIWEQIKKDWAVLTELYNKLSTAFGDMWDSVTEWMGKIWDKITEIWDDVMSFFEGIDLYDIGADIIKGLISGVGSMANSLVKKVEGVVGDAVQGAKNLLGINSPSRVFMEIGRFTGEGMKIGLDKTTRSVQGAMASLASPPEIAVAGAPSSYTSKDKGESLGEALKNLVMENVVEIDGNEIVRVTKKPMMREIDKETKKAKRGR